MRPTILVALAAAGVLLPSGPARATHCTTGTELAQSFPGAGPAVSEWRLCYEILRMPHVDGTLIGSETLVITQAEFRPGAAATPIAVVGDMRMSEIFVPYHDGDPRYNDLTDFAFDLQPLTTIECPATRLDGDRICSQVVDRGLAWRDPGANIARRGEKLVLWSVLNAANYDYVMHYEFYDDGTMEVRAAATGRKLGGADDTRGHFHNFAWRVNLDVAGAGGDTAELAGVRVGSSVRDVHRTLLREGGFKWDAKSFTHLEVEDESAVNGRGRTVGYTLAPVREGNAKFPESWTKFPVLGDAQPRPDQRAARARPAGLRRRPRADRRRGRGALVHGIAQPRERHARRGPRHRPAGVGRLPARAAERLGRHALLSVAEVAL